MTEHDEYEHEVEDTSEKGIWHLVLFFLPYGVFAMCVAIGFLFLVLMA